MASLVIKLYKLEKKCTEKNTHSLLVRAALTMLVVHKNLEAVLHLAEVLKMVMLVVQEDLAEQKMAMQVVQEDPVEQQPLDLPEKNACFEPEELPQPTPMSAEDQ